MKPSTLAVIFHFLILDAAAFHLKSRSRFPLGLSQSKNLPAPLFPEASGDEGVATKIEASDSEAEGTAVKALAAAPASLPSDSNNVKDTTTEASISDEDATAVSSQVFMITREMKRSMIEELGYSRKEVDSIRLELVGNILEDRVRCPTEGMPSDWIDQERVAANESVQETSDMMAKLENESKYPLKFPLLGVSLILFGKGFSDALITLIKVNIDFPGASLTAQFQGIPVLAIDLVCVLAGAGIGFWTFKTMK
eukprot:CAMPEP_0116153840 /NCGR_PEP_ID=MMETSP0329-20121206/21459_1 /TAXON_ID=697910 /ORGANISM="Pseudo-nitzschia arenysensis, Strain B593" /LENGTH=252 /DNA_ID=CAMNT_0003650775 /DNA_START=65 /DNA_END=823 /DNA_ORIENTATION=+